MREQSHKDEMSRALRGDFARLRARGVATTLEPAPAAPTSERAPALPPMPDAPGAGRALSLAAARPPVRDELLPVPEPDGGGNADRLVRAADAPGARALGAVPAAETDLAVAVAQQPSDATATTSFERGEESLAGPDLPVEPSSPAVASSAAIGWLERLRGRR